MKTIWVVVCHPDDEIIWVGNLLINLAQNGWKISIICLTRASEDLERNKQFYTVCEKAGFEAYLGDKIIPPALENIGAIEEVLMKVNRDLSWQTPDLILTHSPYGDEHNHPHHVACFEQLLAWTKKRKIPYAFFSAIKLPAFHFPKLCNIHQRYGCIISEQGKIYQSFYYRMNYFPFRGKHRNVFRCPKYYITFCVEENRKKAMFSLYNSVNIEAHIESYLALSMLQETVYFFCEKGMRLFEEYWVDSKRAQNVFLGYENIIIRIARKILRKISYGH